MKNLKNIAVALFAISTMLSTAVVPSRSQDESFPNSRLTTALEHVNEQLSLARNPNADESRLYKPEDLEALEDGKMLIERKLAGESLAPVEIEVLKQFLENIETAKAGRGTNPFKKENLNVPGVKTKPTIDTKTLPPTGKRKKTSRSFGTGAVVITYKGNSVVISRVKAGGGYTASQRARIIQKRMNSAIAKNALWYVNLRIDSTPNGEYVIKARSYSGALLTADVEWARAEGMTTKALAQKIKADILSVLK